MECPKCESKAIVADTKNYRHKPGEPITQIRVYVCTNPECLNSFTYRNTYLDIADRRDAFKFLTRYEREKQRRLTGQRELKLEEES
jgi:hypothetical protein